MYRHCEDCPNFKIYEGAGYGCKLTDRGLFKTSEADNIQKRAQGASCMWHMRDEKVYHYYTPDDCPLKNKDFKIVEIKDAD